MNEKELTAREREYLDCKVPLVSTGSAVKRVTLGFFASLLQSVVTPSVHKAENKLFRTFREIRYTKYKKAVLHKQAGTLTEKDKKTLEKLNKKDFILDVDTYDADKFKQQIYAEYMRTHNLQNLPKEDKE